VSELVGRGENQKEGAEKVLAKVAYTARTLILECEGKQAGGQQA